MEIRADQTRTQIIQSPRSEANVDLGKSIDKLVANAKRLRFEENQILRTEVERASDLPTAHGLFYTYGLSCYLLGDQKAAEKYLKKAHELSPDDETYLLGLATFYNEQNRFNRAIPLINRLIELNPKHLGYKRLRDQALERTTQDDR